MKTFFFRLPLCWLLVCLLVGCKDNTPETDPAVDLSQARFSNFEFEEVAYADIQLNHPQVRNGAQVQQGSILLVVPNAPTPARLTPRLSNIDLDNFTVTPQLGTEQDFSNGAVVYTIASKVNPEKKVQYQVSVTKSQGQAQQQVAVTGFTFEKSRNPGLSADIVATRIVHDNYGIGKIYVFVPAGTNFAALKPTIAYNGDGLFYSQNMYEAPANATAVYPATGLLIDFSYPKVFYAIVKKGAETRVYNVLVDVRDPLRVASAAVTAGPVARGAVRFLQVSSVTNHGNHALSFRGVTHSNQVPAGLNVLRVSAAAPAFGLNPGESTPVNVTISAQTYPPGTYQATAVLSAIFYNTPESAALLEPVAVTVSATITN